jgi:hypothetical protein
MQDLNVYTKPQADSSPFCYIQVHFKADLTVNLVLALNLCEYLIKLKTNTNVAIKDN